MNKNKIIYYLLLINFFLLSIIKINISYNQYFNYVQTTLFNE